MLVVDAGFIAAALVDSGKAGTWALELLAGESLAAPHLVQVEVANILRRAVASGELTADAASLAHADLLSLRIDLFPYGPFAERVWELRNNVTCYDGWYVALAESLAAPLATLDLKLGRATGPRCEFRVPPR